MYLEIPAYPTPKKLSLKDIETDVAVKQIEPSEIKLGERIAFGASGEVIKGVWQGREIAVKRMAFAQNQITGKFMEDFLYEIKIMSTLDHKNILKFLGASITSSGDVFLVTEFMDHGSVKDVIDKTQGKMDWKLKIRFAIDAARGMAYLHSCNPPIIHRDLKSSNMLVDKKMEVQDFRFWNFKNKTHHHSKHDTCWNPSIYGTRSHQPQSIWGKGGRLQFRCCLSGIVFWPTTIQRLQSVPTTGYVCSSA